MVSSTKGDLGRTVGVRRLLDERMDEAVVPVEDLLTLRKWRVSESRSRGMPRRWVCRAITASVAANSRSEPSTTRQRHWPSLLPGKVEQVRDHEKRGWYRVLVTELVPTVVGDLVKDQVSQCYRDGALVSRRSW